MFTYGEAMDLVRNGKSVRRDSWRDGWYVFFVESWRRVDKPNDKITGASFVAVRTADDIIRPWLALDPDFQAEDWVLA